MTMARDSSRGGRRDFIFLVALALFCVLTIILIVVAVGISPHLVVEEDLLILETEAGSLSAQWPDGSFSIWLWNEEHEWRLWPPGLPRRDRH